jgi:hypothetical protein
MADNETRDFKILEDDYKDGQIYRNIPDPNPDVYMRLFEPSRLYEPDDGFTVPPPGDSYPMEEIKEAWEGFKSCCPVNTLEDLERRMSYLTDDVIMQNPMMLAHGREEVFQFMVADFYWSPPVYYWEAYSPDRVVFKWSQYVRRNKKPNPKILFAISTWKYAGNGKFSHYYARWCRHQCYEVMADGGMTMAPEIFFPGVALNPGSRA